MTKHVDVATLQSWLEEKRPVTVVDVRSSEDRAQWSIPGSVPGFPDFSASYASTLAPDVYVALAERRQVRIRYVLDTHIHADHLSRSRNLANAVGAELLLPSQNRLRFPYRAVFGGDVIELGDVKIATIAIQRGLPLLGRDRRRSSATSASGTARRH